jgi:predicted nucleic acid-binding protein
MSGGASTEKLAVDANVLISAVIRGKAARIIALLKENTRFITTDVNIEEVKRGLAHIAHKRGLDVGLLLDAVDSLPVESFPEPAYRGKLTAAKKRIAKRDPTDADLLALALTEGVPIWSQDKDFEECGVELYTTERLLKELGEA